MLAIIGKLRDILPLYMVPTMFIPRESLPLTVTGKRNRKQLRKLAEEVSDRDLLEYRVSISPQTEVISR
jgi:brevianamide F synthase